MAVPHPVTADLADFFVSTDAIIASGYQHDRTLYVATSGYQELAIGTAVSFLGHPPQTCSRMMSTMSRQRPQKGAEPAASRLFC